MNSVASFVRLDFYTVKPYRNSYLFLLAFSVVMTVMFKSIQTMTPYLFMSLMMTAAYPFSIGEKDGLDTLYSTLSLQRNSVVLGRYFYFVCLEAVCAIFLLAASLLFSVFFEHELNIAEVILIVCASWSVCSVLTAMQFPIYFKMGYNRAKLIAYLPMLSAFAAIMAIYWLSGNSVIAFDLERLGGFIESNVPLICVAFVVFGFASLAVSCALSCRLYSKRDF